jgi:hypothetical protein
MQLIKLGMHYIKKTKFLKTLLIQDKFIKSVKD